MSSTQRTVRKGRVFPDKQITPEEKARYRGEQTEFYQRCWAIFEGLKPELREKYEGWYIAIEPDSGDYFIDSHAEVASQNARQKHPHQIHGLFRINETGVIGRI